MIQKKPQNSLFQLKNEEKKHFFAQKFGGSKKRDVLIDPAFYVILLIISRLWHFAMLLDTLLDRNMVSDNQRVTKDLNKRNAT